VSDRDALDQTRRQLELRLDDSIGIGPKQLSVEMGPAAYQRDELALRYEVRRVVRTGLSSATGLPLRVIREL
jgi:hypothetical protein